MLGPFRLFLCLSGFLAFTFAFGNNANAQTTPEAKTSLQNTLQETLDMYTEAAKQSGVELTYNGPIEITDNGSYYAAKLPHLTLKSPSGGHTDIGVISINAMQGDTPELWKMTLALPSPMASYDAEGSPLMSFALTEQKFAGVWHQGVQHFVKLNAEYNDVSARDAMGNGATIGKIKSIYDLNHGEGNNLWSGPMEVTVSNVQGLMFGTPMFSIDQIKSTSHLKDYNVDAVAEYQQKLEAFLASVDQTQPEKMSADSALATYNLFTDFFKTSIDSFKGDFVLTGLKVNSPMPAPDGSMPQLNLGELGFGFGLWGLHDNEISIDYMLGYDDLSIVPLEPSLAEVLPSRAKLAFRINKLPYDELVALGRQTIEASAGQLYNAQMLGMQAVMSIPAMLTQANTNIKLDNTFIGNDQYNIALNGTLNADHTAVKGLVGQGTLLFSGITSLLQSAQTALTNPDVPQAQKQQLQQVVMGLGLLQTFGEVRTDDLGRPARFYDFELTKEGDMLLNGQNMNALMGIVPTPAVQ